MGKFANHDQLPWAGMPWVRERLCGAQFCLPKEFQVICQEYYGNRYPDGSIVIEDYLTEIASERILNRQFYDIYSRDLPDQAVYRSQLLDEISENRDGVSVLPNYFPDIHGLFRGWNVAEIAKARAPIIEKVEKRKAEELALHSVDSFLKGGGAISGALFRKLGVARGLLPGSPLALAQLRAVKYLMSGIYCEIEGIKVFCGIDIPKRSVGGGFFSTSVVIIDNYGVYSIGDGRLVLPGIEFYQSFKCEATAVLGMLAYIEFVRALAEALTRRRSV